jgi:RNA polymerase primary sigma factor
MDLPLSSHLSNLTQLPVATREQVLISKAKERGYVTFEEVQALYPDDDKYLDAVDALLLRLIEAGVTPVSAASVQPVVEAIAASQRREVVSPARAETHALPDLVDLYLEEIRQFSILTRDEEMWLGIAMECPALTLDNSELPSNRDGAQNLEAFFGQLLKLAATEGARVLKILVYTNAHCPSSKFSRELGHLIQEVQLRQQGSERHGDSALLQLVEWCPEKAYDNLFDLCAYLWALLTPELQFLQKHILTRATFPSEQAIRCRHLDRCTQLDQQINQIRRRADQARHTLILHNLRLVTSVAWRYQDQGLHILDLYQEGNKGLIKAVDRFDYRQGNKFSTYAVWWIRQSITRAIAEQSRTIRLPVYIHGALRRIHRAEDALEKELGRGPSIRELAQKCEMSPREVKRALNREPKVCSIDSLLCCSEFPLGWIGPTLGFVEIRPCPTRQLAERLYATSGESSDDSFEYPPCIFEQKMPNEIAADENVDYSMLTLSMSPSYRPSLDPVAAPLLSENLERVLKCLTNRERFIIEKRFGLPDGQDYTLEELGEELGLTRERVRQIESKALGKLGHPKWRRILRDYLYTGGR